MFAINVYIRSKVKPANSGHPKYRTYLKQETKCLVPNKTISVKLPLNSGDLSITNTAQKMKFSIYDFFSKRDQIRSFLRPVYISIRV